MFDLVSIRETVVTNQLEIVQAEESCWLIRYLALLWLRKLLPLSSCAAVKSAPACLQAMVQNLSLNPKAGARPFLGRCNFDSIFRSLP